MNHHLDAAVTAADRMHTAAHPDLFDIEARRATIYALVAIAEALTQPAPRDGPAFPYPPPRRVPTVTELPYINLADLALEHVGGIDDDEDN